MASLKQATGATGIVALTLVAGVFTRPHARSNAPPPASIAAPAPAACSDPLRRSLEDVLHDAKLTPPEDASPAPAPIHFLLATIADPVATNLSLFADRTIESIAWAVSDSGYEFDRYWLPWPSDSGLKPGSLADLHCQQTLLQESLDLPGILLFRTAAASGPPAYLAVLMLGETPTAGVNPKAFEEALRVARRWDPSSSPLPLLGPTFSGSLAPLAGDLLAHLRTDPSLAFSLASGSTTNKEALERFRALTATASSRLQFHLLLEDDTRAFQLLRSFITRNWPAYSSIALLREDETAYGKPSSEGGSSVWSARYPREIARLRNASGPSAASDEHTGAGESLLDAIRSDLRNESADLAGISKDSPGIYSKQQSPASQQTALLNISTSLRRHHADYVGITATDILDTLFLSRFVRLSAPDARVFVLDSDLLFVREAQSAPLAGILAVSNYPLFTRNQYWTKPENSPHHEVSFTSRFGEGTYNACRYLFAQHGLLRPNSTRPTLLEYRWPLPCTNRKDEVCDSRRPPSWLTVLGRTAFWPIALLDEPASVNNPTSLVPGPDTVPRDSAADLFGNRPEPEFPTLGWSLLFLLLNFFALAHSIYVLFLCTQRVPDSRVAPLGPRPQPPTVRLAGTIYTHVHEPVPGQPFRHRLSRVLFVFLRNGAQSLGHIFGSYPTAKSGVSGHQAPFLFLATLVLACAVYATTLCLWPVTSWHSGKRSDWWLADLFILVGAFVFAALLFTAALVLLRCFWLRIRSRYPRHRFTRTRTVVNHWDLPRRGCFREYRVILVPALLAFAAFVCIYGRAAFHAEHQLGFFFAYRGLNLTDGVSPLIPILLLLLGFYQGCLMHLRREERLQFREEFLVLVHDNLLEFPDDMGRLIFCVDECISHIFSFHVWRPALLFVFVWLLFCQPWHSTWTLEPASFTVLYALALIALYSTLALCWAQFLWTWSEFRKFLEDLELKPVRSAFSRLQKQITWMPLIIRKEHRFLITTRSSEVADAVLAFDSSQVPGEAARIQALQQELRPLVERARLLARELPRNFSVYHELQTVFDNVAMRLHRSLSAHEWIGGSSESLQEEQRQLRQPETIPAQERFRILQEELIGLRYLIYMRYVFRHLRNMIGYIVTAFVISVLSWAFYPFQGHHWLAVTSTGTLLALGTGIGLVFAQMDRDAVLSRITETRANEVGKTFLLRMAQYGALPLLTVVGTQIPAMSRILAPLLAPALEALR